ncbi:hypothetical protein [Pseudoxanthomonas broegbernensis]|uniref:hypothetical protein n=1 Tax=Pseudoxanthomonas broegbernensis TaxID=83619 RepID=UPI0017F0683D|nr:hypothetical protein [Pseudoxanthomonas broegbernensis]MBB6064573.1 uncharacterized protein (TIGR02646 family) [Pseudoxanthomonas broegbernensis]
MAFPFKAYKHDEVKRRLDAIFHGKCAYCETFYSASAPVDVEHFRPKGSVSEDPAHPGYWWIAMAWDNLLPSCIDCNRKRKQHMVASSASLTELRENMKRQPSTQSGKQDSFPIKDGSPRLQPEDVVYTAEQALLLNPCVDVPRDHLEFVFDGTPPVSLVVPRADPDPSERGAVSIQVYGLNRLGLVQERTRVLRHLEFLGDLVLELGELIDQLAQPVVVSALAGTQAGTVAQRLQLLLDRTVTEMKAMASPTQPYSAIAETWLAAFAEKLDRG